MKTNREEEITTVKSSKLNEVKFILPPLRPEKSNLKADTSLKKCETTVLIPKDNARFNPDLDIIIQQKKKNDLFAKLEKKRLFAKQTREKLEMQWGQVEENEMNFQKTIIAHNRFLKRNLEKRERALAKIQADTELTKKREKEIKALHQKHQFFNTVLNKMRLELKGHNMYEEYLNAVLKLPESNYKSTFELLTKFESLDHVRKICVNRQNEEMATTVLLHEQNVEFFRLQDILLIGLRNDLNNLRCSFEEIKRKNLATETLITSIVNKTNQLKIEVSSCQYMIDYIYRYICQRRKMAQGDYALNDVKTKIETLKDTLNIWSKILASPEYLKKNRTSRSSRKQSMKTSIIQSSFMWKEKVPPM